MNAKSDPDAILPATARRRGKRRIRSLVRVRPRALAWGNVQVRLDTIVELDAWRREDLGEFRRHIRVIKRPIEVLQHFQSELGGEIERAGLRALASLLHDPAQQVEAVLVATVGVDPHLCTTRWFLAHRLA